MVTLEDLSASPPGALESLFRTASLGPRPRGRFRGRVLGRVDSRLARSRRGALILVPFERTSFGIDFDSCAWFFGARWLQLGHFRVEPGPSRWRDAEVLRLRYDVSRLPSPIRGLLYDEVKPLDESLCLGLGGIDRGPDHGDLFFFSLERVEAARAAVSSAPWPSASACPRAAAGTPR